KALLARTQATFGADEPLTVFFRDPELLTEPRLQAIRAALDHLAALPQVARVESLFTAKNVKSVDGQVTSRPYLDRLPASEEAVAQVLGDALRNPLIARNLLSTDGRAMVALVSLHPKAEAADFEQQAVAAVEAALRPLAGRVAESFVIGSPYVRVAITESIRRDQWRVLPLALGISVLTLALALRRVNAAVVPLLTGGVAILWTLGLMAAVGIPVSILTSIVPALIVIVGSSEATHLLAEYYGGIEDGLGTRGALLRVGESLGLAVLLTFGTTYVGFLSTAASGIQLLRDFGLVSSTALLLSFLVTITLIPAYLAAVERHPAGPARPRTFADGRWQRWAVRAVDVVLAHRAVTLVLLGGLAAVWLWGAAQVRINNDPLDYFASDAPTVQRLERLRASLAGAESFSIVVRADIRGTFQQVHYLQQLRRIQEYLAASGRFDVSMSFADFVAFVNAVMEEDRSGALRLPETDDVVREYLLFVDHKDVAAYVSADFSTARILVRHGMSSSSALRDALAGLEAFVQREIDPGLHVEVTGDAVLAQRASDNIGYGQASSLALMFLVIGLVVSLLYVNAKAGLIAVVPMLFPIAALFGVMGYAGIPLDTSTAMVASISLGICDVLYLHFMSRYQQHTRAHGDQARALRETVREEVLPMVSTAVALALGFAVFAVSSFPPVVHFGLLSAMVLLVALLVTLLLLPILLSTVRLVTLYDLLTLQIQPDVLRDCEIFRGMRPWQVKKLVLLGGLREYASGDTMVRQGERAAEMFVILDGAAAVWQQTPEGGRDHVRDLRPGEMFGEIALVCESPRTADVVAVGSTRALSLEWTRVQQLGRLFPGITAKLSLNLAAVIGRRLACRSGADADGQANGAAPDATSAPAASSGS
nr:MMPL family transporter [Gammaproteobacteria bacterium]